MAPAEKTPPIDGYDPAAFPPFAVTVDVVLLTLIDDALHLALIERGAEPYLGMLAVPGGFKRPDETLEAAAARELREEGGARDVALTQFGAYGDPGRDPRMDVVTVGFTACIPAPVRLRADTDAAAAGWYPVADVLDGRIGLAFDHARIVRDAHARLSDDLERTDAVLRLVRSAFTLSQLRRAYEAVWRLELPHGAERDEFGLDKRNFRRQLEGDPGPFLVETGRSTSDPEDASLGGLSELAASDEPPSSRPGRPASYHSATRAWREASPVRRPKVLR